MKFNPRLRVLAFSFVAVQIGPGAFAQVPPSAQMLMQRLTAACPKMVEDLLAGAELSATTQLRPIGAATVCACTMHAVESQPAFAASLKVDEPTFVKRLQSEKYQSYLFTAMLSGVFGCLSTELNATLDKVSPE